MTSGRHLRGPAIVALTLLATPAAAGVGVGVTTRTFTKTSASTGMARPLETVIWYPAAGRGGTPEPLGRRDAPVRRGRFPLIVFSHGSCGRPTEASYLTIALARAGFVVAAPPHHPNTADEFPACATGAALGDAGANRVPDVRFVIDAMLTESATPSSPFAGRLRADAIGISGLSFGAYTTLLAAAQEPRARAAVALVPGGSAFLGPTDIPIPAMVIGAERDRIVTFADSVTAYGRLAGPRFLVKLLGGDHLSVVDECVSFGVDLCGDLTPDAGHQLVLRYAVPFFRRYLGRGRGTVRRLTRAVAGVEVTAEPTRVP